jgi:hypothetical protein
MKVIFSRLQQLARMVKCCVVMSFVGSSWLCQHYLHVPQYWCNVEGQTLWVAKGTVDLRKQFVFRLRFSSLSKFVGWGEAESTWHVGHYLAYCTSPSATLSTTNPTWPDPGSNLGHHSWKQATNLLGYGPAPPPLQIIIENWPIMWISSGMHCLQWGSVVYGPTWNGCFKSAESFLKHTGNLKYHENERLCEYSVLHIYNEGNYHS